MLSLVLLLVVFNYGIAFTQDVRSEQAGSITLYFKTASSTLDSATIEKLDSLVRNHPNLAVSIIAGFADSVDNSQYNQLLSQKRSEEVARWLRQKIPGIRIDEVRHYGETQLASRSENAINRRVVVLYSWKDSVAKTDSIAAVSGKQIVKTLKLDKLYFIPDKAILEPGSVDYLHAMIDQLKQFPEASFEIRGHVNKPPYQKKSEGFEKQLQQLSEARAKFVYDACLAEGISASRMSYQGLGSSEMVYPNPQNDDEKRMNMRVEIRILAVK